MCVSVTVTAILASASERNAGRQVELRPGLFRPAASYLRRLRRSPTALRSDAGPGRRRARPRVEKLDQ